MVSTPGVTIELAVTDQDSKRFATAPAPVRVGAVRVHGWQAHLLRVPPGQFAGQDAYLVKLNYELATTPDTPDMNWFEFGVELRAGAVVDAVPHHTQPAQGAVSYVVNDHLNLVPAGVMPAVHLAAAGETIHAFGVGSNGVRWQHVSLPDAGVRPGSRSAWLVTLVEEGVTHLDVTASARFDLRPAPDWNVLPDYEPVELRIDLDTAPVLRTEAAHRPEETLQPGGPRVFISYAHDNKAHKQQVRDFANLLMECGIDVRLDQFESPWRRNWHHWAVGQIDAADFVIVVASPKCLAVGEGKLDLNEHPGMQCELGTLFERLQANRTLWQQKLLPVVLPGELVSNLPVFLQPQALTRYEVDELTEEGAGEVLATIRHGVVDDNKPIVLTATNTGRALAD